MQIKVSPTLVQQMVREYLLFHGYGRTLSAFENACQVESPTGVRAPSAPSIEQEASAMEEASGGESTGPQETTSLLAAEVGEEDRCVAGSGIAHGLHSPSQYVMAAAVVEAEGGGEGGEGERRRSSSAGSESSVESAGLSSSLSFLIPGLRRAAEPAQQTQRGQV